MQLPPVREAPPHKQRKQFFFYKRTEKLLLDVVAATALPTPPTNQSFFVSFCSQKEVLPNFL
jgi:hypothetical protein